MIYIIDGKNRDLYGRYLMQMHKQRYDHFVKVRGWEDLDSLLEYEIDEYDSIAATYVVVVDQGRVIASIRLMSTYFGTLLGEKYADYITDGEYAGGSASEAFGHDTWEMYRLYQDDSDWRSPDGVPAIRMLWVAMMEYLQEQGARRVVAVSDSSLVPRIPPALKYRELGFRHSFKQRNTADGEFALVEIEVNNDSISNLKKMLGYEGNEKVRAEISLDAAPTSIMPEQVYIVANWLENNLDRLREARELLAASNNNIKAALAFKDMVREAMIYSMGSSSTKPEIRGPIVWN